MALISTYLKMCDIPHYQFILSNLLEEQCSVCLLPLVKLWSFCLGNKTWFCLQNSGKIHTYVFLKKRLTSQTLSKCFFYYYEKILLREMKFVQARKELCNPMDTLFAWCLFAKGPFIYYVSTWRGEGVRKLQYIKHAYVGRRGIQKAWKCAYVIYGWSPSSTHPFLMMFKKIS